MHEYTIVCPFCYATGTFALPFASGKHGCRCPSCKKLYYASNFIVRYKRSKIVKLKHGMTAREFNIRVYDADGDEQMIQVMNHNDMDLELRSKDLMTLSYDANGQIRIIGNQNINYHLKIKPDTIYRRIADTYESCTWIIVIGVALVLWQIFGC